MIRSVIQSSASIENRNMLSQQNINAVARRPSHPIRPFSPGPYNRIAVGAGEPRHRGPSRNTAFYRRTLGRATQKLHRAEVVASGTAV